MNDRHIATHIAKLLAETTALVEKGSWTLLGVGGGEGPGFHYTIGAYVHKLPELIVFGLPYETGGFLNPLGTRLKEERPEIEDGLLVERIIRGYAMKLRLLGLLGDFSDESEHDHFGYLIRFAKHRRDDWRTIEVAQVLWPDKAGRFPDEAGCTLTRSLLLRGARPN